MSKKVMIDIETTQNNNILVTKIIPKGTTGILAAFTPKTEPEIRSFNNYKEFSEWLKQEVGIL